MFLSAWIDENNKRATVVLRRFEGDSRCRIAWPEAEWTNQGGVASETEILGIESALAVDKSGSPLCADDALAVCPSPKLKSNPHSHPQIRARVRAFHIPTEVGSNFDR